MNENFIHFIFIILTILSLGIFFDTTNETNKCHYVINNINYSNDINDKIKDKLLNYFGSNFTTIEQIYHYCLNKIY